jgi:hypothetical protein
MYKQKQVTMYQIYFDAKDRYSLIFYMFEIIFKKHEKYTHVKYTV